MPRHVVSFVLALGLLGVAIGCPASSTPVDTRAPAAARPIAAAPLEPVPGAIESTASGPATAPARERRWSAPVDLDPREGHAMFPKVAMDANGNAMVAWYHDGEGRSTVHVRRFDSAGARWDPRQTFAMADRNGHVPQVAMTRAGAAVLVWAEHDHGKGSAQVARYAPATGWGDREALTPWQPGSVFSPSVAINERGDIVAVWELVLGDRHSVHSNRFDAASGTWSGPEPREQNRFLNLTPIVAQDDLGNAIVAWTHYGKSAVVIHVARFDAAAGTWQAMPTVAHRRWNTQNPAVTMGPRGAAWITWASVRDFRGDSRRSSRDQVFVDTWAPSAGRWEPPVLLGGDSDGVRHGKLLRDDAALVAVWAQAVDQEQHLWWREFDAGAGAWSPAAAIDTKSTGISDGIDLASDGAGNVLVVWERHQDDGSDLFVSRLDHSAGRWSTPTMLDTDEKAQTEWAAIAAAVDGTAIVAWTEAGDHRSLHARRFE